VNVTPPPAAPPQRLPRLVYALAAVSFCTDLGSEMVLPLLPALAQDAGASFVLVGLLSGIGEVVIAAMKIGSGIWSDRLRTRKPWLVAGYGLSAAVRPLFALLSSAWAIVALRAVDRVGKGLRGAPRDALLADSVPAARRGAAFGVQRAWDHAGALAGALVASGLLALGCAVPTVFAWSLLPGFAALAVLVCAVHETPAAATSTIGAATASPPRPVPWSFLGYVVFAAASTAVDLFVLLRARELGVPVLALPLLWALLHVVRSALAVPFGRLGDRFGAPRLLALGLLVHAAVLIGFAFAPAVWAMVPLFALHGLHAAITEGPERALVAKYVGKGRRGRAYGMFHAVQGLAAAGGAVLVGAAWDARGALPAFLTAAALALMASAWIAQGERGQRRR
jgi:MFS family permease